MQPALQSWGQQVSDAGLLWGYLNPAPVASVQKPSVQTNSSLRSGDVLVAQGVDKSFGDVKILSHIDLQVHNGEILALVGPSGCGKSTLLNILSGLLHPDAGKVISQPLSGQSRSGIAYMFQEDRLLPWRTVRANVGFGLENTALTRQERAERTQKALALVGLEKAAEMWPHELSGGMRSRVALARSLAVNPQVLLMDEPFSRLDPQTRAQMHAEVLRLHAQEKVTVVLVTHDMEEAIVLADRIVRLVPNPGRVAEVSTVDLPRPRLLTDPAVMAQVRELRLKV